MSTITAPINRVIGDISYFSKYLGSPGELDEIERIQVHLHFVEEMLRKESSEHLTALQQANRHKALDILKQYNVKGEFPKHDGKQVFETDRRPRFIDNNTFCAVGYLIKETEGEQLARDINRRYEYAYVDEMDYLPLLEWANRNGLSGKDCARIQPSYFNWPEDCPFVNATLGTTLENKMPLLRNYRDNTLSKSLRGRALVKFYYLTSPATGFLTRKSPLFRSMVLAFLKPAISRLEERKG